MKIKHALVVATLMLTCLRVGAQTKSDTVKFLVFANGQGFPGVNFFILGTTLGTVSNATGLATLMIPPDKDKVRFSGIDWPYGTVQIYRPVDSIFLNCDKMRATYYFQKRKMRSKRLTRKLP